MRQIYKRLQQPESTVPVLTFLDNSIIFQNEDIIHIFGTNLQDYKVLSSVGKKIYIIIRDKKKEDKDIYEANIEKTGHLPASGRGVGWSGLEKAYWGLYEGTDSTELKGPSVPPEGNLIHVAKFWGTITIEKKLPSGTKLEPPDITIPYELVEYGALSDWERSRGWIHPERRHPPQIERPPFDEFEEYITSNNKKVEPQSLIQNLFFGRKEKEKEMNTCG